MEALGLHLPQLIAQIVGFLVLLFILSKLLYKPLLKIIDERSAKIKESLEAAESAKEQAAASQEQMQEDIRKAREEGQQMIAQARDVAVAVPRRGDGEGQRRDLRRTGEGRGRYPA